MFLILLLIIIISIIDCLARTKTNKYAHLSIDDTIEIFKDLSENEDIYNSIFENNTLEYFRNLNQNYGVVISCYCFYEYKGFSLKDATDKYREEFIENSDWLKFGFHAYKSDSNYEDIKANEAKIQYDMVIEQLVRICGEDTIDRVIRIHNYNGNEESINAMKNTKLGVIGLLSAEDDRKSYNLNEEELKIKQEDSIYILRDEIIIIHTDYRIEDIKNIEDVFNENNTFNKNILVIFTHEWIFSNDLKNKLENLCKEMVVNKYIFKFPMNQIENVK